VRDFANRGRYISIISFLDEFDILVRVFGKFVIVLLVTRAFYAVGLFSMNFIGYMAMLSMSFFAMVGNRFFIGITFTVLDAFPICL
jgi:hypothetical protein